LANQQNNNNSSSPNNDSYLRGENGGEMKMNLNADITSPQMSFNDMMMGGGGGATTPGGIPSSDSSATNSRRHNNTANKSTYVPPSTNRLSRFEMLMANRNATACFKGERESLIEDLHVLWQRIDFLEDRLIDQKQSMSSTSKNASLNVRGLQKQRKGMDDTIKELQAELRAKSASNVSLSQELATLASEKRLLHSAASTLNVDSKRISSKVAKENSERLTEMRRLKLNSDERGDELQSDVIFLKREHARIVRDLENKIENLQAKNSQQKIELGAEQSDVSSLKARWAEVTKENDVLTTDLLDSREANRLLTREIVDKSTIIKQLTKEKSQQKEAFDISAVEYIARVAKSENEVKERNDSLIEREKEIDKLRHRTSVMISDAEGEVETARNAADALREKCNALEEQNEGLTDRYREAEVIVRNLGRRDDSSTKRLVDEMRQRESDKSNLISERSLLNKQWEKREKEIMAMVSREARKVELREERIVQLEDQLEDEIAMRDTSKQQQLQQSQQLFNTTAPASLFGSYGTNSFGRTTTGAGGGGYTINQMNTDSKEEGEVRMRRSSGGAMSMAEVSGGTGAFDNNGHQQQQQKQQQMKYSSSSKKAATPQSARASRQQEKEKEEAEAEAEEERIAGYLYQEFKEQGEERMAAEARNMVAHSGRLLKKIEQYDAEKKALSQSQQRQEQQQVQRGATFSNISSNSASSRTQLSPYS
jgi:hypothetical protein